LDEVLSKTEWSNVKRIFWKLHPASAGLYSFPIRAPQRKKLYFPLTSLGELISFPHEKQIICLRIL
jgi:hypothetical protein